jgi:hypothetical protein
LNELPESKEFEACEAVFLMDNCSPHVSDGVISVFTNIQVQIIRFGPHTTYVFQMRDVVLFGALKKCATGVKILDEEQQAAVFLLKVYHDFK